MRVDAAATSPFVNQFATSAAKSAVAPEKSEPASPDASSGGAKVDFTGMTRKDMFDWMNSKIQSGEMTLDESSPFLAMTVKIEAGADSGSAVALDDAEQVNFLDMARDGIEFARQRGDDATVARLQYAMDAMQRYQGTATSMDLRV